MRILPLLLLLAACEPSENLILQAADEYEGFNEVQHQSVLREYVGVDPRRYEWCAAFANAVLHDVGIPGSESVSDYPLMARSFLTWGEAVNGDPQPGDVVVFPRGNSTWKGHVGFYVSTTPNGNWIIIGGNQDNSVSYATYNPNRALAVRRYKYSYENQRNIVGKASRTGLGVLTPTRTNH